MKYPSKVDLWLAILIWGIMLGTIGIGLYAIFYESSSYWEVMFLLLSCVLLPLFILWGCLTTYYLLSDTHLIIRYGPFKKRVPLDRITSVKKTSNPLSSPALSLKRLEISYNTYDMVLISPKDRDAFIKVLSERCEQLTSLRRI
ncbi:PH domain-containing protein [Rossellomorea marisflavi]|uniref:PH domain-containing protein n=1 Tax=Rossellomorea marisflavi TaxID=189381 RepID=UPI001EE391B5|nr:PH domain-containing protein [Rossellomorea marisflavi]UKS66133.1 PH domain-containing protein [Rossellomorea marisflavi]